VAQPRDTHLSMATPGARYRQREQLHEFQRDNDRHVYWARLAVAGLSFVVSAFFAYSAVAHVRLKANYVPSAQHWYNIIVIICLYV
jgi:hypothetical protein